MKRAEFLPGETIDVAGRSYDCDVLRVWSQTGNAATTLWIDRTGGLVLRYVSTSPRESVSVTLLSAEINPTLPSELFQFEPPPGYREVLALCCWGPGGFPTKR
jgi:outer membrane lipoprotein-sorting protein